MDRGSDPRQPDQDRLLLNALADGELDAATTLSLEERLQRDPLLRAEYDGIGAAKAAIQRLGQPAVSDEFRERIAALAAPRPARLHATRDRPWLVPGGWRSLAASILITAIAASGATYMLVTPPAPASPEVAIAENHMRSLLAANPVDIASSDRHTVKPWLDVKLGVSPPAIDLADQGFALVGGRVDVVDGHAVPTLVYRHNEHLISLIAVPIAGDYIRLEPQNLDAGGYHMVKWSDGGFSYWAASDVEVDKLNEFVKLYRSKS
ncbi:anti-sigma factor [Mesorhizobium sp. BAC0120]|uniref:anti-sigma factor family protein n=1 Tax=Mesorhizobium sp. BAC0120 TaxID=3090670 RepID=UPI00298CA874|nr:anti-sigma factor [Mesorhizobium sp. BAC0120]MDW6021390.1 anti-sigma factor [Mesorhizobium sp. BAC0120]